MVSEYPPGVCCCHQGGQPRNDTKDRKPPRPIGRDVCDHRITPVLAILGSIAIGSIPANAQQRDDLNSLNQRVDQLYAVGTYAEATEIAQRALALAEDQFGPDHPTVVALLSKLGSLYFAQSDWTSAAEYLRGSTRVVIRRAQRGTSVVGEAQSEKKTGETEQRFLEFSGRVKATYRLASTQGEAADFARNTFETAQWAQSSEAAETRAQMVARDANNDPRLAALVKERQDLAAEWRRRDQIRSAALAQVLKNRNREAGTANNARLTAITTRMAAIDQELAAKFPQYAALASAASLSVEDVQKQLGADEALVLFLDTPDWKPTPEETFIWVVTRTDARWVRSDLGTPALTRAVTALRCGFDHTSSWTHAHCSELLEIAYTRADHNVAGKPLPFDLALAHKLYKGLFGDIEDLIKDKRLLIVPSGPLTQLPFQVLVIEPPKTALANAAVDYRDVAWLARTHAISVLPAVSSLRARLPQRSMSGG
jgi:Tetratricopeptide repeat